jgi:hypothetical protein
VLKVQEKGSDRLRLVDLTLSNKKGAIMLIRSIIIGAAISLTIAGAAFARDYTYSNGKLTDAQFYKAVTCKAKINASCQEKPARWPAFLSNQLTVGLAQVQKGTSTQQERVVRQALQESVDLINDSGANIKLRYVSGWKAKRTWIKVHIVKPHGPKHVIKDVSLRGMSGLKAQNARTKIYANKDYKIARAGITISNTVTDPVRLRALVLEELVQSLGLMWDIENPYYNTRSIFSQSGPDNLLKIEGQDKAALQRHYPF